MSFKTIIVCPSNKENTHQLTKIACGLVTHSGKSRVLGTHWVNRIHEFKHGEQVSGRWSNEFDSPMDQNIHDMSNEFCRLTGGLDYPCEWKSINAESGRHNDVVVEYARCCDLVVTPAYSENSFPKSLTTDLIVNSGRPVLVVPEIYTDTTLKPDTVSIAWNASRESARAAFESLPFLKRAKKVEILWIEETGNPDNVVHYLIKEFASALAYHEVSVSVEKITVSQDDNHPVSHQITQRAGDISADLLIAGAFGQTGAGRAELGSVSTRLLASTKVPLMFST